MGKKHKNKKHKHNSFTFSNSKNTTYFKPVSSKDIDKIAFQVFGSLYYSPESD